uniref:16S/18S rRNA aminocarboxypropyltransferase Tsr3 C-terminal domain-containing protein n=1 Tax=Meloidogyne enterolobii TaxID=390850 RepID=A0A6V7UW91_MELEN|nr:unnamed protein product [Meloidogyne enterolobii]
MDLMLDIEFAGGGNEAAKDVPSWILLTPTATSTLSPSDSKTILSRGLAVVDCSWNQLDKTAFHRAK